MRIEIHPKPDGMQHVNFMFSEEDPGPEDLWVNAMLTDFSIPPKRELQWERDGVRYNVLQYGECVIGNALFYIEKHKGVVEFNQEAKYTVDGNGGLTIAVDEAKLRDRIKERLEGEA